MEELENKTVSDDKNKSSISIKGCIWWIVVIIGVSIVKIVVKDFMSSR